MYLTDTVYSCHSKRRKIAVIKLLSSTVVLLVVPDTLPGCFFVVHSCPPLEIGKQNSSSDITISNSYR